MIADSTDINFACSHCGQHMVVDKSAAGLKADCPICHQPITVPLWNADQTGSGSGEPGASGRRISRPPFANLEPEETREELFDASMEVGRLERELEAAREDLVRQQALIRKTADECERLKASATHAHAELKSFQGDRQPLKTELAQARQRAVVAEDQVVELTAALDATAKKNILLQEQIENDLAVSRELRLATETQLATRERELRGAAAENAEIVQALAGAQAELAAEQANAADLRRNLDLARREAAQAGELLALADQERKDAQACLDAATHENQRLHAEHEALRTVAAALQRDLIQTDGGRELLDLRERVQQLEDGRKRMATEQEARIAELQELSATQQILRAELEESQRLHQEAERRAEGNSESQLRKDNEILRGINQRDNATLNAYHHEIRRHRRVRYTLHLLYLLFGLGLIALTFFALSLFAPHGAAGLFGR